MSWLPEDFAHPVHAPVPDTALHLRPIREADIALDYPAEMGSRERLREIFGPACDDLVDSEAEHALDALVPQWIAANWPFRRPRYLGRDITWQDWLALPAVSAAA